MSNLNTALNGIVTNVDALASKVVEIKASVANKVSYVSDDKGRTNSILLANNEMLLGSSTNTPASGGFEVSGGADNHNLIMVNKWNVVDVGSPKVPLTLNTYDGIVKINDSKIVATTDQIDNMIVSGKIKDEFIPEDVVRIADVETTLEDYQTVAGMDVYAKTTDVDSKVTTGVTEAKTYTDEKLQEIDQKLDDILTQVAELKAKIDTI